jgi:hypothetical protein
MSNYYTEDFSDIMSCARERMLALDLLNAWHEQGLPEDFSDDKVRLAFNRNSGYVFLVNDDYQCAMMNGEKLESFYTSPYAGIEGFFDDLLPEYADMHPEDQHWFSDIASALGRAEELATEEAE